MDLYNELGIWAGAICTLIVLSFLYKENWAFRIIENITIGIGAGYYIVWGLKNVLDIAGTGIQKGEFHYIVPIILGILFYLRLSPTYSWLSKWPIALVIGVSIATALTPSVPKLLSYIIATGQSILTPDPIVGLTNLLTAIITLSVIVYFIYTREEKGVQNYASSLGRYGIMTALAAVFAGVVATRLATMIDVVRFLLYDWLKIA